MSSLIHIQNEPDFHFATDESNGSRLLPKTYGKDKGLTWAERSKFVVDFLSPGGYRQWISLSASQLRNTRWGYGELRQDRLTMVYRFSWANAW